MQGGSQQPMWRRTEQDEGSNRLWGGQQPALTAADLDAARHKDPDAVGRIYVAYAPALTRFFVAGTGDRYAAEDLVSKVFEAAIRSLPGFRGPIEALGGWLFQIARHDLLDWRRTLARHRTESLDDRLDEVARAEPAHDPQDLAANRVDSDRILALVRKLSPDQQQVIMLRLVASLSINEVAEAMGKTVGAVKALQHRGLASLLRMSAAGESAALPVDSVRADRGVYGSMTNIDVQEHPYPSGTHRRLAGEETER
jgi:RNA polymerase sigma-70 factor, ECF subfamily